MSTPRLFTLSHYRQPDAAEDLGPEVKDLPTITFIAREALAEEHDGQTEYTIFELVPVKRVSISSRSIKVTKL